MAENNDPQFMSNREWIKKIADDLEKKPSKHEVLLYIAVATFAGKAAPIPQGSGITYIGAFIQWLLG